MKKALILIVILLIIGSGLIYISPYFLGPKFIINNNSQQVVEVTAEWRSNTKELGKLQAGKSIEFHVKDEAGMKITAKFPNGKKITNQPVYFTSGMVFIFDINENGIESAFR
ncbi:MAG: hypothetical protein OEY52_07170 [Gammaproteobacteria bacterium]|nr:hypothetical protein [Gammaproteobacteria bacterium]